MSLSACFISQTGTSSKVLNLILKTTSLEGNVRVYGWLDFSLAPRKSMGGWLVTALDETKELD